MQPTKTKEIVYQASVKDNLDQKALQSIVDYVFKDLRSEFKKLSNLSIYVDSLGIFFYGKKRLEDLRARALKLTQKEGEGGKKYTFLSEMGEEGRKDLIERIDELLKVYEEYVREKRETRRSNKESQTHS